MTSLEDTLYSCRSSTPSLDHVNSSTGSKVLSEAVMGTLKNAKPIATSYHLPSSTYHTPSPRSHIFNLESCLAKYRKPKIFDYPSPVARHYSFNSGNLNSFCGNRGILSSYFSSHKDRPEQMSGREIRQSEYTDETQEIIKRSTIKTDRKCFKKLPILSSTRPLGLSFSTPKRMVSMIGHRKISNSQERPLLMGYQTDPDEFEHASFEIIPNKNGLKISPVTPASTHANNFNTKYSSRGKFSSHTRPLLFMKP